MKFKILVVTLSVVMASSMAQEPAGSAYSYPDPYQAQVAQDPVVTYHDGQQEYTVEPGQMCRRNPSGDIECLNVDEIAAQQQPQYGAQGLRVWDVIEPRSHPDIMQRFCPRKKEYALAHFQNSVRQGDVNRVIESYFWNGKEHEQAQVLVDQLALLPKEGVLERSFVVQWTGSDVDLAKVPVYVRWAPADQSLPFAYFAMRADQGCWFMEFVGAPSDEVYAQHAAVVRDGSVINQIEEPNAEGYQDDPNGAEEDEPSNFIEVH